MKNHPVISTAKVRGLIKKNGMSYVDATRRLYPTIATGISVWQLCDSIYFQVYGYCDGDKMQINFDKFASILDEAGFAIKEGRQLHDSHQIIAKVGA